MSAARRVVGGEIGGPATAERLWMLRDGKTRAHG